MTNPTNAHSRVQLHSVSDCEAALLALGQPITREHDAIRSTGVCHGGDNPTALRIWQGHRDLCARCYTRRCDFIDIMHALFGIGGRSGRPFPIPTQNPPPHPSKSGGGGVLGKRIGAPRYFPLHKPDDTYVIDMVRQDYLLPDGTRKKVFWYQFIDPTFTGPPGELPPGLEARDLPLYGVETVAKNPGAPFFFTEGGKARDALVANGFLAIAHILGANSFPNDQVLQPLIGVNLWLWPDNDPRGWAFMRRVERWLAFHGGNPKQVYYINPHLLAAKGDAYDFFAEGGTPARLGDMMAHLNPVPRGRAVGEVRDGVLIVNNPEEEVE